MLSRHPLSTHKIQSLFIRRCAWLTIVLGFVPTLVGCYGPAVGHHQWEMLFTDLEGNLRLIRTTSDSLFSNPNSVDVQAIKTKSKCLRGWSEPTSGKLATLEEDEVGPCIRLYGKTMELLGEYRPKNLEDYWTKRPGEHDSLWPSMPILDEYGRIAFVDNDGGLSVGRIINGGLQVDRLCFTGWKSGEGDLGLFWFSKNEIALRMQGSIFLVDVDSGKQQLVRKGGRRLFGVVGDRLVIQSGNRLDYISTDDEVLMTKTFYGPDRPGRWYRAYPRIHIWRLSPDGEFVAYDSTSFWGMPAVIFRHLESGKDVALTKKQIGENLRLGSWNETTSESHSGSNAVTRRSRE